MGLPCGMMFRATKARYTPKIVPTFNNMPVTAATGNLNCNLLYSNLNDKTSNALPNQIAGIMNSMNWLPTANMRFNDNAATDGKKTTGNNFNIPRNLTAPITNSAFTAGPMINWLLIVGEPVVCANNGTAKVVTNKSDNNIASVMYSRRAIVIVPTDCIFIRMYDNAWIYAMSNDSE